MTTTETTSYKRTYIIVISVLAVALAAALFWGSMSMAQNRKYEQQLSNNYDRNYNQLLTGLADLEVELSKLQVASTSKQSINNLMEVWRQTGDTQAALSQMPISQTTVGSITALITRMGDFSYFLTQRLADGQAITEEQLTQLKELENLCVTMQEELRSQYDTEKPKYTELKTEEYASAPEGMTETAFTKLSASRTEYPHLIYDGPFSEAKENQQPKGLGDKAVDAVAAKEAAKAFIGAGLDGDLTATADLLGSIECYGFTGRMQGAQQELTIYVTKTGGKVLLLNEDRPTAETAKPDDARARELVDAGTQFLAAHGYGGVASTYTQFYNGQAVVNYAPIENGVLLYPDLIKLWIDIDTGRVCGVDARNYLMFHGAREMQAAKLTMEEARAVLNPGLEPLSQKLALIPSDTLSEHLCYEFIVNNDGSDFLIYIDATDGSERAIQRVIHTDTGALVM